MRDGNDQGYAQLDGVVIRRYERESDRVLTTDELRNTVKAEGPRVVLGRVESAATTADRRSTAVLTGAALVSAITADAVVAHTGYWSLFFPALLFGLGALVTGIRATTRRVEVRRTGLPANWADVELAHASLTAKQGWTRLSAKLLRTSLYWLAAVIAVMYAESILG